MFSVRPFLFLSRLHGLRRTRSLGRLNRRSTRQQKADEDETDGEQLADSKQLDPPKYTQAVGDGRDNAAYSDQCSSYSPFAHRLNPRKVIGRQQRPAHKSHCAKRV
jgi:hypothetical protein